MSRALICVAALTLAAPAYADASYFSAIEDLPMPPGFVEAGAASTFDAGGGRVVVVEAEGAADGAAVRDFYYEALPQLGWAVSPRTDGALVFQRGREELSFTLDRDDGRTRLGARLVTHPASTNAN
ncbi:MAG: hypothetical protein R3C25_01700 [Hyphomonadaceae bacterium]